VSIQNIIHSEQKVQGYIDPWNVQPLNVANNIKKCVYIYIYEIYACLRVALAINPKHRGPGAWAAPRRGLQVLQLPLEVA